MRNFIKVLYLINPKYYLMDKSNKHRTNGCIAIEVQERAFERT